MYIHLLVTHYNSQNSKFLKRFFFSPSKIKVSMHQAITYLFNLKDEEIIGTLHSTIFSHIYNTLFGLFNEMVGEKISFRSILNVKI